MIINYKVEGASSLGKSFTVDADEFMFCETLGEIEERLNDLIQEHFNQTVFPYIPNFSDIVSQIYGGKDDH